MLVAIEFFLLFFFFYKSLLYIPHGNILDVANLELVSIKSREVAARSHFLIYGVI